MARKRVSVSESLRQAIIESGQSTAALQRATGVANGAISRFLRSERSLTLSSVDRLAAHLGLVLRKG